MAREMCCEGRTRSQPRSGEGGRHVMGICKGVPEAGCFWIFAICNAIVTMIIYSVGR